MSLVTDCLAGISIYNYSMEVPLVLDFVANGESSSLVVVAGWWKRDWNSVGSLFVTSYDFPAINTPQGWKIGSDSLCAADDEPSQSAMNTNRDIADFDRANYLAALLQLKDEFPNINFDDWIAAIQARPLRDPLREYKNKMTAIRQMAKVYMLGQDGNAVDVLVLDDLGQAAQASSDPWLSRIAGQYRNMDQKPPLADYVNWVASQTPYGGNGLVGPAVFQSGGDIGDVASTLLSSRNLGASLT